MKAKKTEKTKEVEVEIKTAIARKIAIIMNELLNDKYKNDILIDQNHQFNNRFFDLMTDIFLTIFYTCKKTNSK